MDRILREYIDTYGGKNGPLLFIREKIPGGPQLVPPMEIEVLGDLHTKRQVPELCRAIAAACEELKTDQYIARTSYPGRGGRGDWEGLVDAMPTLSHIPVETLEGGNLPASIARSFYEKLLDPRFLAFARKEGIDFDPDKVTIAFSPQVPFPHSTVTDHPNRSEFTMVDIAKPLDDAISYKESGNLSTSEDRDFEGGAEAQGFSFLRKGIFRPDRFSTAMRTREQIREWGILDDETEAYQLEGACRGEGALHWILQLRLFAQRRTPDFSLDQNQYIAGRILGITPSDGMVCTVLHAGTRIEAGIFEDENPGVPYLFVLETSGVTQPLTLSDQTTKMVGYKPKDKPYLSHQNTRAAQEVLLRPYGLVDLSRTTAAYSGFVTGDQVRIISDGRTRTIERA
ncbi:MAG: hypothetical protein WC777_06335 [Candidatus Gracilibacteria bacterium]|jgi:hypothetical protein